MSHKKNNKKIKRKNLLTNILAVFLILISIALIFNAKIRDAFIAWNSNKYQVSQVTKEKIEEIENRMNSIKEKVKADNLNALMTMVSDGSMSVYGEGSRFNIIYNELGFMSADSSIEISNHGQSISNEYLVSKNPDYLFVIDKGAMTGGENQPAKEIIENELVKTTDTYKNGNIVYLDPQTWYVGGAGIKAANEMLNEVEEALK